MRSKTFILGLLGVVLLIIVGGTMYFFFGNKSKKAQPQPQAAASQVKLLVGGPVVSPILSFNGETVWFMTKDGKMFRKALEGTADKEEYTLPAPVENLIRIFWPKDGADFIVEQNVNGHYGHKFFDPQSKTLIDYDEKVVHPRFLAGDRKIVYIWASSPSQLELTVSDPDTANYQKISSLYPGDYDLEPSPLKQEVALFSGNQTTPTKLTVLDLATGKFRDLGETAVYEGVRFSPDGTKILAAKSPSRTETPHLVLFDLTNSSERDLGIGAFIENTVWGSDGSYLVFANKDGFKKYMLGTGEQQEVYKFSASGPGGLATAEYQPTDMIIHPTKPLLIFVDQKTGNLYRLDLK